ncbi:hybrid sensor histidine kinase/response regulator [Hahella sp. HN01]|uniref:hybrid sensor histidine kinase/response regulator n=1 Tax=Hahella sp. HN01 TaxID=2847262 RepID=UPI001C1EDAE2|nr:hybrid sensor histidine kinase/response regulator [Hahella sp. HN01]MBU6951528.1 response regulator [Hahella sp. HN01]
MKARLISTLDPAPPGFTFRHPQKRDLVAGPVVVVTDNAEQVLAIVDHRSDRLQGAIVSFGDAFDLQPLGPRCWLLQAPHHWFNDLAQIFTPMLKVLDDTIPLLDESQELQLKLERASRDLSTTHDDYQRVNARLQNKVEAVTKAQGEILALNTALEKRVDARTAELAETNRKLLDAKEAAESANEAKSLFLATMSHEIRTPMNGILGMLELLSHSQLSAEQTKMISTVRDSAFSLLNILNDILDFSKIEAGRMELENITLSVEEIIEGVAETVAASANKRNLHLHCYVDPDIPDALIGDEVRLRQILFNLCSNATKFTDTANGQQGCVTLRADLLHSAGQLYSIRISVKDNGIGMDRGTLDKLFSPFTQGESSTTRRYGGTGLGLSICKRLTEIMGGAIEVASEPKQGTEFRLNLTLAAAPGARIEPPPTLDGIETLVVLSDELTRATITSYLLKFGATVQSCQDIKEASVHLSKALQLDRTPPVLLTYAEQDGDLSPLLKLRGQPWGQDVRFIILTPRRYRSLNPPPDSVKVYVYPLCRNDLVMAAAAAAGRCSPPVRHFQDPDKIPRFDVPNRPGLHPVSILVAEDNLTNQEVIRLQLKRLGLDCIIVENGCQALAVWQQRQVDLVLTDCHMPEMDGFQLTSAIREKEGAGLRTPIIAITANALRGEAERCLHAGMDDYLSKPVEIRKLYETLAKWLPHQRRKLNPADHPEMVEGSVDLNVLSDSVGPDIDVQHEILTKYREDAAANLRALLLAAQQDNPEAVTFEAHRLKSSSRAIGAEALGEWSEKAEMAGRGANWRDIRFAVSGIEQEFEKVDYYLQNWLAHNGG